MDDYKEYLYQRRPHYRSIDPGDLTAQLAIREKLNCKPFSWFMKEVAFDLTKKYPPVEPPLTADGEVGHHQYHHHHEFLQMLHAVLVLVNRSL